MPDVVRSCVLDKSRDFIPFLTFSNLICCPSAIMEYHAEVIPPCVLSKGKDGMSRLTSSDRVYFLMGMKA